MFFIVDNLVELLSFFIGNSYLFEFWGEVFFGIKIFVWSKFCFFGFFVVDNLEDLFSFFIGNIYSFFFREFAFVGKGFCFFVFLIVDSLVWLLSFFFGLVIDFFFLVKSLLELLDRRFNAFLLFRLELVGLFIDLKIVFFVVNVFFIMFYFVLLFGMVVMLFG